MRRGKQGETNTYIPMINMPKVTKSTSWAGASPLAAGGSSPSGLAASSSEDDSAAMTGRLIGEVRAGVLRHTSGSGTVYVDVYASGHVHVHAMHGLMVVYDELAGNEGDLMQAVGAGGSLARPSREPCWDLGETRRDEMR